MICSQEGALASQIMFTEVKHRPFFKAWTTWASSVVTQWAMSSSADPPCVCIWHLSLTGASLWPEIKTARSAAHFQEMISVGGDVGLASRGRWKRMSTTTVLQGSAAELMGCRRGEGMTWWKKKLKQDLQWPVLTLNLFILLLLCTAWMQVAFGAFC